MVLPQYNIAQGMLRVAAKSEDRLGQASLSFNITGKMGGLGFTKTVTGAADLSNDFGNSVQWAFRKSEELAQNDWYANADSIKAIGKDFHIVTRQTSLLALEPGMELWEDTLSPQSSNTGDASNDEQAAPSDERGASYTATGGMNIDSLELGDMIEGLTETAYNPATTGRQAFSAFMKNRIVQLSVPHKYEGGVFELKLFDMRGRLVISRIVQPSEMINGIIAWDIGAQNISLATARYLLKISVAETENVLKLPVIR
jgi:hypothetical protein